MIVAEYYRSTEICRMRQHMAYREADYSRDCRAAIALAKLLAVDPTDARQRLLDATMMRIQAYSSNNPEATP